MKISNICDYYALATVFILLLNNIAYGDEKTEQLELHSFEQLNDLGHTVRRRVSGVTSKLKKELKYRCFYIENSVIKLKMTDDQMDIEVSSGSSILVNFVNAVHNFINQFIIDISTQKHMLPITPTMPLDEFNAGLDTILGIWNGTLDNRPYVEVPEEIAYMIGGQFDYENVDHIEDSMINKM